MVSGLYSQKCHGVFLLAYVIVFFGFVIFFVFFC